MAAMIKGITVKLHEKTKTGTDAFNKPIYSEIPVDVENVLVTPVSADDVISNLQLTGKRAEYELCIPKGDAHVWENRKVEFFGQMWQTFGISRQWIAANIPLDWNKKIKVERYE
ncbi:MAG: hypothetical protein ACK5L3_14765 [Oscillospiraceae bacterium]